MTMTKLPFIGMTLAAALALAACGDMKEGGAGLGTGSAFDKLNQTTPTGSAFDRALFDQYAQLAKSEYNQGDFKDSDMYSSRALQAAQGQRVEPESVARRGLPPNTVSEITGYRERLVKALDGGARERVPSDAAHAQAMFDCWTEQQEENRQPNDIAACRNGFLASLARIEMAPVAAGPQAETFTLYFAPGKATLTRDSRRELQQIIQRARANHVSVIRIEGFADRTGSPAANLRLSQRREAAVHDELHKAGINARIEGESFGEDRLAVQTADNVAEAKNRRVVVSLIP